mmetsp:Transcript_68861/g.213735  ORF Transcript_68861/g.213735 Transcript_68861/m.213735 type:complete len:343 (+) Transcript_68861:51-1079(+)
MSMAYPLLESQLSLRVFQYLDSRDLSAAELAGCSRAAATACWRALLALAEQSLAGELWFPRQSPALPEHPKEALCELQRRLRGVLEVPEGWAPCIQRVAFEKLRAQPRLPSLPCTRGGGQRGAAHHGGMEDCVGLAAGEAEAAGEEEDERQPPGPLSPPRFAAVPLSLGLDGEEGWVVGVRLSSQRARLMGEGCLLAVEFLGVVNRCSVITSVLFAPVSGRCFNRFTGVAVGLMAQAMPALEGFPTHAECEHLEAFARFSATGGVSFYRRCGVGGIECTGELSQEFFPSWGTRNFASLTFQVDQLKEAVDISISWVGRDLPPSLKGHVPTRQFDATWSSCAW